MEVHFESGVTEQPLPLTAQIQAKLLGATRAHGFSDGSMAMQVIYRNFFRPHDDFVCRYAIYDAGWDLQALLPCEMSDPPVSLAEYRAMMRLKEKKRNTPSVTIQNVSEYVTVHKTATSLGQIAKCAVLGFEQVTAFSDKSIGATVKYSNHLVPSLSKSKLMPPKSNSNSVEMGFVLDQNFNELARYPYRTGNRLLSWKEYECIRERQEMEKEREKRERAAAETAAAKGYDARNTYPLADKLQPKPQAPKKDLGRIFSNAKRYAFWENQANVMSIYDSFNQIR
jgi:hypothetical protein